MSRSPKRAQSREQRRHDGLEVLDSVAEGMLLVLICVAPWLLGGRLPWVASGLAMLTTLVAAVWLAYVLAMGRRLTVSFLYVPMLAFLAWTGLQPSLGWADNPYLARTAWLQHLAFALAFMLAVHAVEDESRANRLFKALALTGVAVGIVGLVQHVQGNGLVLWIYEPPWPGLRFGPFDNRNYFAAYTLVAVAPALALLFNGGINGRLRPHLIYLAPCAVLAVVASMARAGILGMAIVAGTVIAICAWSSRATAIARRVAGRRNDPDWRERRDLQLRKLRSQTGTDTPEEMPQPDSGSASASRSRDPEAAGDGGSAVRTGVEGRSSGAHEDRARGSSSRYWLAGAAALVLAVLVGLGGLGRLDDAKARLGTVFHLAADPSFSDRLDMWSVAIRIVWDQPLYGQGMGNFERSAALHGLRHADTPFTTFRYDAHNEYLRVLAETGVPGMLLAAVFVTGLLCLIAIHLSDAASNGPASDGRSAANPRRAVTFRAAAAAGWLGFLAVAVVDSPAAVPALDYALAILAAFGVGHLGKAGPS